ncbi:MAG: hypothetical protein ACYCT9_05380 [Leptospirillum sp.]
MSAGKIAEYPVGIDGPLVLVSTDRNGRRHSRFGSWWLAGIGSKDGGVAPASLPLSRTWHNTHPGGCP